MATDIYTLTVTDGVTVSSPAGLVTGWGYSLHNESSSLWLVTTGLSTGPFQHATPDLIFDFPDLAPGATVTVAYDPLAPAGLYQILWDADPPAGFVNSGMFNLTAEWWDGDPLNGGSLVSSAPSASVPYSASPIATPEPGTFGLAALAMLGSAAVFRLLRKRRATAEV
jgi:hypothetical protein